MHLLQLRRSAQEALENLTLAELGIATEATVELNVENAKRQAQAALSMLGIMKKQKAAASDLDDVGSSAGKGKAHRKPEPPQNRILKDGEVRKKDE